MFSWISYLWSYILVYTPIYYLFWLRWLTWLLSFYWWYALLSGSTLVSCAMVMATLFWWHVCLVISNLFLVSWLYYYSVLLQTIFSFVYQSTVSVIFVPHLLTQILNKYHLISLLVPWRLGKSSCCNHITLLSDRPKILVLNLLWLRGGGYIKYY